MTLHIFQGGIYVFQLVDWYMGTVACFVMAILECVIVGWCYGILKSNYLHNLCHVCSLVKLSVQCNI